MSDIQVKVGNGFGTIPSDSPAATGVNPTNPMNPSPIQPLNSQSSAITQQTNKILGGTYFDPTTGAQVKQYDPSVAKSVLENAANAGGDALSKENPVPTRGASTSVTTPDGTPLNDFNFQAEYDKANGGAPKIPDLNAQQSSAEAQFGVPAIQNNIANLTTTLTNLENDLQNRQAQEASKPGVVASIINGRMQMLSAEDSKALNDLKGQISSANTQLAQANTAVATMMKNNETNYQDASAAYKDAYARAYQSFTAGEAQMSKEEAQASTNAKVIIDSFKGTSNASKITPDQEAQWHTMEMQAGLPQGFIKAAIQAESTSGTKIDHWQSIGGKTYAFGTDSTGKPVLLQSFNTPEAPKKVSTTERQAASEAADAPSVINDLKSKSGNDHYVSDSDYALIKQAWVAGGHTAASFDTRFGAWKTTNKPK